jgi:predicted PurR-regulated permease PerM
MSGQEEASSWLTRRQVPPIGGEETRRDAWVSASRGNRGAYLTVLFGVGVVVATGAVIVLAYVLRNVLLLLLIAVFLSLVLSPAVAAVQRRWHVQRRGAAVALVVCIASVPSVAVLVLFGRPLLEGFAELARTLPERVAEAQRRDDAVGAAVRATHLTDWLPQHASDLTDIGKALAGPVLLVGRGAISALTAVGTVLSLVVLLLMRGPQIRQVALRQLSEPAAEWCTRVGGRMNSALIGSVVGNSLTSVVAGAVTGVGLTALGVPVPWLWALWVALVDFIPMIGATLGAAPTVVFAALQSTTAGVLTLLMFVVYQQFENRVLSPLVMSRTAKADPLLVTLSLLCGSTLGHQFGGALGALVAALLAVPTAAAAQILAEELLALRAARRAAAGPQMPAGSTLAEE